MQKFVRYNISEVNSTEVEKESKLGINIGNF
jgi:hypothetical protein